MQRSLEDLREAARNYRRLALTNPAYPKALTLRAVDAAWRSIVRDYPELAEYRHVFIEEVGKSL